MKTEHHVYSRCWGGGHRHYLHTDFSGSRTQCETYIRTRVRHGLPTHFLFISQLDITKATRRHM